MAKHANQYTGASTICPICRRPDARDVLEALAISKNEACAVSGVPHATFYRWISKHEALPPHPLGPEPDPLTANPERLQREVLVRLMAVAKDPGNYSHPSYRIAALKAASELASKMRSQTPPAQAMPHTEPVPEEEAKEGPLPSWMTSVEIRQ